MKIDRRNFLIGLGAMIGGVLVENAVPTGRVYSFPGDIKIVRSLDSINYVTTLGRELIGHARGGIFSELMCIYDSAEFWSDPHATPVRVKHRYGTASELDSEATILLAT